MAYTEKEIEEFKKKDIRISKQGLIQALITSGKFSKEEIEEVNNLCSLAEKYRDYVYNGEKTIGVDSRPEEPCIVWKQIAEELNLAIPTAQNVKILDALWDEYKAKYKVSANPSILFAHIIDTFGKLPTKKESIVTILESLKV